MSRILGYLVSREGRKLYSEVFPMWCADDINYTVVELVANDQVVLAQLIECRDARDMLSELYALQEEEIGMLRERLKGFEK